LLYTLRVNALKPAEPPESSTSRCETDMLLSISLAVYNERATLKEVVARIQATQILHEIIIVDDGSTDGTDAVVDELSRLPGIQTVRHARNRGKGAALRTAFARATGNVVIVQDADLEYDPAQYAALIAPITSGEADVVYGSRFLPDSDASISFTTLWANRVITGFFNVVTRQRLTDVETCYKAFRRETLALVLPLLVEDRFGIEIELAARLAKIPGVRVVERPIRYRARSKREGKKIRWTDGVRALWCVVRYR